MSAPAPRWSRLEELFHQALERAPDERAGFLAERCGGDAALEQELAVLLAASAGIAPNFLEPPGSAALEGRRVGPFTLVRLLGQGGMGAVYEARQEQPARAVALKLVRALPGVAHDRRRLEREAQAMARLRHPNVAQIFAAGTLADAGGELAWFALELVPGARDLVRHCAAAGLAQRARIELFLSACRAVQHGHQQGVVHCDLKPDNLLVDAHGTLKVIDFGIARLLGREPGEATEVTRHETLLGSLAYMSPEQARPGSAPDTRSDVYSLGVVLYELLAGQPPFDLKGKSVTEALALLAQVPPPAPSRLRPEIDGELETIVLHALAKDPDERYASVLALGEDLRRWLASEPILARPPSAARRLRLFARRNRVLVGAGLAIVLSLTGASLVSLRFGLRAVRAAESAERAAEAERGARLYAERVAELHRSVFDSVRPARALGRELTVRELLDDALFHAERQLADAPEALAEMLATIGATQTELGNLEQAERLLERGLALLGPASRPALRASLQRGLAMALTLRGAFGHAEELLAPLIDAPLPETTSTDRTTALYVWSQLMLSTGRTQESRAALEGALTASLELPPGAAALRGRVLLQVGQLAYSERDYPGAERHFREALALVGAELPPLHPATAAAHNSLACALFDQGDVAGAEQHWSAALAIFERVLDPSHPDLATVLGNLGLVHQRRQEFDAAAALYGRALELRRAALGDAHPQVADLLGRFSEMELVRGDLQRGVALAEEAVAVIRRAGAEAGAVALARTLFSSALARRRAGQLDAAQAQLEECLELQRSTLGAGHADLAQTLTLLGALRLDQARAQEAEPLLREAYEIRLAKLPGHWLTANTASLLGGCLLELENEAEAEPLIRGSLEAIEASLGRDDFRAREARARLERLEGTR